MKSSVYSSVSEAVMAARGAFGRYSELTLNERNEMSEQRSDPRLRNWQK